MTFFNEKEKRIARILDPEADATQWNDWHWQLEHSIRRIADFERVTGIYFEEEEKERIRKTLEKFPLSITPYYLALIDTDNYRDDPIFKQSFPTPAELIIDDFEMEDSLHEDTDSPVPGLTHRYPDRVLFLISGACAMYCRHCTRKRRVGDQRFTSPRAMVEAGIAYIRENTKIRDILLSGGEPLLLDDQYLDWLLGELRDIPHVEIIRIGTRLPVVLPSRIDEKLINVLKKHHPVWINTHFNHPVEFTPASVHCLKVMAEAGFPMGNQTVLLAGINDCPRIIRTLCHKLAYHRVRPYYLYQCDFSEGLSHFRTSVSRGIEILENMIGHTSGYLVPTYVVDAPGGGGKIPLTPNYLLSWSPEKVILRNYEGKINAYKEPGQYSKPNCGNDCSACGVHTGDSPVGGVAHMLSEDKNAYRLS